MSLLKILIAALGGFLFPITIALCVGPLVFSDAFQRVDRESLQPARAALNSKSVPEDVTIDRGSSIDSSTDFMSVASDGRLDPDNQNYFFISTKFRVSSFPRNGRRQKIVSKYLSKGEPYPGWALAIRKLNTSIRPEVYWQSTKGGGGWFTFDSISLKRDHWYSLTFVARADDLMALYLEDMSPSLSSSTDEETSTENSHKESGEASEAVRTPLGPQFLGGYNLALVPYEATSAPLEFIPPQTNDGEYRGELDELLLARPEKLPKNRNKLQEFISGGPTAVAARFQTGEISLWVNKEGKDLSPFHRMVEAINHHS